MSITLGIPNAIMWWYTGDWDLMLRCLRPQSRVQLTFIWPFSSFISPCLICLLLLTSLYCCIHANVLIHIITDLYILSWQSTSSSYISIACILDWLYVISCSNTAYKSIFHLQYFHLEMEFSLYNSIVCVFVCVLSLLDRCHQDNGTCHRPVN